MNRESKFSPDVLPDREPQQYYAKEFISAIPSSEPIRRKLWFKAHFSDVRDYERSSRNRSEGKPTEIG